MLKQLLEYFTKEFIKRVGRKPQTAAEMMSIQDDAVRYLNKTKGVPEGPKKPPFQGFTPKVIEGGKLKEGIGKAYDKFYDKTGRMRDRGADIMQKGLAGLEKKTLFKDSPEAIAKMKAENKAAIERLKKKKTDNPEDMASGGIARVGYAGGGRILKWLLSLGSKKPKSMFEIEELAKKQNIIKKDEVIIKQEGRDSKTGKDIIEYDVYKKSDKNQK